VHHPVALGVGHGDDPPHLGAEGPLGEGCLAARLLSGSDHLIADVSHHRRVGRCSEQGDLDCRCAGHHQRCLHLLGALIDLQLHLHALEGGQHHTTEIEALDIVGIQIDLGEIEGPVLTPVTAGIECRPLVDFFLGVIGLIAVGSGRAGLRFLGGCVVVRLSVVLELVESLLIDSRLVVLVSVVTLLAAKDHVMSPFRNRFKTNRLRAPNLNRPARP